jgi:hypothetical protein
MQDIPLTQLLVLLAFILFPLINWLLQRMQRRYERQPPRQPPPQPAPRTFTKPLPVEVIASVRERTSPPELREIPPPGRRQTQKRALFRSRRDLRRAIILMTVLGPCRAAASRDAENDAINK